MEHFHTATYIYTLYAAVYAGRCATATMETFAESPGRPKVHPDGVFCSIFSSRLPISDSALLSSTTNIRRDPRARENCKASDIATVNDPIGHGWKQVSHSLGGFSQGRRALRERCG